MMARLKSAMNRLAGTAPPDPGRAESEIRGFVLALQRLATFARVGAEISRGAGEARR